MPLPEPVQGKYWVSDQSLNFPLEILQENTRQYSIKTKKQPTNLSLISFQLEKGVCKTI